MKVFLITAQTNHNNIDVFNSTVQYGQFPEEAQIYLKNVSDINIISTEIFNLNEIYSKKPIKRTWDIPGAPFKINDKVTVSASEDETFNSYFLGKTGTVEYFEYDCGSGQSFPNDPLIGIRFDNSLIEEFWKEEIKIVSIGN